jgi:starch phosphorylase
LAAAYCKRAEEHGKAAAELLAWVRTMASHWHEVRFGAVQISTFDGMYSYIVEVHLGSIRPADVRVEIYADLPNADRPFQAAMVLDGSSSNSSGAYRYSGAVPSDRPADHYTPRIVPRRDGILVPLEVGLIAWQK